MVPWGVSSPFSLFSPVCLAGFYFVYEDSIQFMYAGRGHFLDVNRV